MKKKDEVIGILYGHFETGFEGTAWSLMEEEHINKDGFYSYAGLNIIKPLEWLVIYEKDTKPEENKIAWQGAMIPAEVKRSKPPIYKNKETGLEVSWKRYPDNPSYGQLQMGGAWIHWIPTKMDYELWFDVFFRNSHTYYGKIIRNWRKNED